MLLGSALPLQIAYHTLKLCKEWKALVRYQWCISRCKLSSIWVKIIFVGTKTSALGIRRLG